MNRAVTVLAARGVHVALGGRPVLHAVDFGIGSGEIVGLLGPNGAGKTTLLRALAGLQRSASGRVELLGREIAAYPAGERARRLAYLPQGGSCHWAMNVEQVVGLGRLPYRAPWAQIPRADQEAVQRAMQATDIVHLAQRPSTELSGGERSRVLLARALAVEAPVLLADEPIAGLDPAHQLGVMELLRSRAQAGTGVVVTLHDLTLAARYCDRLLLLKDGGVVADAMPGQVLTDEIVRQAFAIEVHRTMTSEGLLVVPFREKND